MAAAMIGAAERGGDDLLHRLESALELPMIVLGLAWLGLAAAELVTTLPPWLEHVATGIWTIFLADFVLRLWLARDRGAYLRHNWLTIIALAIPALRIFRVARVVGMMRAARAVRGVRVARMVTTFGRARRSIHRLLARRHSLGYVIALTLAVAVLGAAGMLAFERDTAAAFEGYGHALWWTAMLLTTMGGDTWPRTLEGRALCWCWRSTGSPCSGTSRPRWPRGWSGARRQRPGPRSAPRLQGPAGAGSAHPLREGATTQ